MDLIFPLFPLALHYKNYIFQLDEIFEMSHAPNHSVKPSTSTQRLGLQPGINNCLIIRRKVGAEIARRNKMREAQIQGREEACTAVVCDFKPV